LVNETIQSDRKPSRHATAFGDPKAGPAAQPDYGRDMSSAHTNRL
jgi:hypothetical protein